MKARTPQGYIEVATGAKLQYFEREQLFKDEYYTSQIWPALSNEYKLFQRHT